MPDGRADKYLASERKKQPSNITWFGRIGASIVGVLIISLCLGYPVNAGIDDTQEFLMTLFVGLVVGGGMLYVGERNKI